MGEVVFKSVRQLEKFISNDITQSVLAASSKAMRRAEITMVKQSSIELRKYYNLKAKHAKEQFISKSIVNSSDIEDHHAIVSTRKDPVDLIKFLTPSAISRLSKSQKGIPVKKRPKARIQIRKGQSTRMQPRFIYQVNGVKKVGLRTKGMKQLMPQRAPSASAFMARTTNSKAVLKAGFDSYIKNFVSYYYNRSRWYGKKRAANVSGYFRVENRRIYKKRGE